MKINKCPNCGSKAIRILRRIKTKRYFLVCEVCHFCSKTKLFKFRAIKEWNKSEADCANLPVW